MLGLVLCLAIAGFFSTYTLTESPKTWFDEGIFLQVARNVLTHGSYVLRVSPTDVVSAQLYTTVGFPVIAPVSFSFALFGIGLLQARVVMVGYILLLVAACYVFVYRVWGFRTAFLSTLIVATHAPLYGNGKNVLGEVPGLFFFFVLLAILDRLERLHGSARALWIYAGLAAGMFMATKPNFFLLAPILGLALLVSRKRLGLTLKNLTQGLLGFFIPLVIYFLTQFAGTISVVEILKSYSNPSGIQQLTGLALPALIQKNLLLFVQQLTPVYLLVTFAVWVAYVCVRVRQKASIPVHEIVTLGFSAVTIVYFLKMPGFFRYLFVAQIITFPYLVASLFALAERRKLRHAVTALLIALTVFQAYQVLFHSFVAGYYRSTRSAELAAYFREVDPSTHVFFYHAPEAVTFFRGENFSQYFKVLYYNDAVGKDQLTSLEQGVPDRVLVAGDLTGDAKAHVNAYRQTKKLDEGRYIIFERK